MKGCVWLMPGRLPSGMGLLVAPHRLAAWQGAGGVFCHPAEMPPKGAVAISDCSRIYYEGAAVPSFPQSYGLSALLPHSLGRVAGGCWPDPRLPVCFWCSLLSCDFVLQKLTHKSCWPSLRGPQRAGRAHEEHGGGWGGGKHWGKISQSPPGACHTTLHGAQNSGPIGILQTRLPDTITWF